MAAILLQTFQGCSETRQYGEAESEFTAFPVVCYETSDDNHNNWNGKGNAIKYFGGKLFREYIIGLLCLI